MSSSSSSSVPSLESQQQKDKPSTTTTTTEPKLIPLTSITDKSFPFKRVALHILRVGLRMALYRIVFGLIKQLFMKGAILKGFKKISVGIETELISFNPIKWAAFGMSLSAYRPVQVLLEKGLRKFFPTNSTNNNSNNSNNINNNNNNNEHPHEHSYSPLHNLTKFLSVIGAGALVSLPVNRVFNKSTRVELMLYVVVRAIHSMLSGLLYPSGLLIPVSLLDKVPTEVWNCTSLGVVSALLLTGSTFHPETHSREYANFLVTATTMQQHQMQSGNCMHLSHWSPAVADFCYRNKLTDVLQSVQTNPATGIQSVVPSAKFCRITHPRFSSCTIANLDHIFRHFLKVSLPLYGPLKLITTIAKSPTRCIKHPLPTLAHIATSVFKSGMFLTLYVCMSYRIVCLFNQYNIKSIPWIALACGINCGLCLLLEPLERQTDLVLFCSMHALRCTTLWLSKFNYIARPTMRSVAAAHTIAWATIFLVYEARPSTLRGLFASMLKMFVGDKKEYHPETIISHQQHSHPHRHGGGGKK